MRSLFLLCFVFHSRQTVAVRFFYSTFIHLEPFRLQGYMFEKKAFYYVLIWSVFFTDISGHIWDGERETGRCCYSYYWTFIIRFYYWSKSKISLHMCVRVLASKLWWFLPFSITFWDPFTTFHRHRIKPFFSLVFRLRRRVDFSYICLSFIFQLLWIQPVCLMSHSRNICCS